MKDEILNYQGLAAALAAGKALGAEPVDNNNESPTDVIVVPDGYKAVSLEGVIEKYLPSPRRVKASAVLTTCESFTRYVNDFRSDDTRIFANVPHLSSGAAPSFTAILDYHSVEGAAWCEHRAGYACEFTEEWRRWMAGNGKKMGQGDFAAFLEENQKSVVEPSGADLLELVSTLEGHNNINVSQLVRLNNGRFRLNWEENVELKGSTAEHEGVELPKSIKAQIQMFKGGVAYVFDNRLRYRVENRRVTFWFDAVDIHVIVDDAVKDVVAQIEKDTEIKPLFGAP